VRQTVRLFNAFGFVLFGLFPLHRLAAAQALIRGRPAGPRRGTDFVQSSPSGPGADVQKKVFLSCSSRDQEIALTICRALEARGHPCWMSSRDVMPGENFQGAIVRAIRSAGVMVMVFSANANNSDEIKKEIALAGQTKLMVIPVRVEDVTPSEDFSYELATRQWVDLFRNWEFALDQLGRQIDYVIPKETPEAATSVAAPAPPPVLPQARAPESAPPKQTSDAVAPRPPARTSLMAGKRKPLALAAGLLLLIGAGVAAFVFQKSNAPPTTRTVSAAPPVKATLLPVSQKTAGNDSASAKAAPPATAVAAQAQPVLNPLVKKAVDAARAAEKRARAAQAKARRIARQAEAAAKQAEAGAVGYGVRNGHTGDNSDWQWKGQVGADSWPSGVGIFTITSGGSKSTRYAGEIKNHARNGSGIQTSIMSSRRTGHYEGEWRDDTRQGAGVYAFSTFEEAGQWVKDDMVSGVQKETELELVWVGDFRNGSGLGGYGARYDERGDLIDQGIFAAGELKTDLTEK
jgi:hypothetical protein